MFGPPKMEIPLFGGEQPAQSEHQQQIYEAPQSPFSLGQPAYSPASARPQAQ
jgi:hypothetical protein